MSTALTTDQQRALLSLARNAIISHLTGQAPMSSTTAALDLRAGCFVTLKQHGMLRGCIGTFASSQPLTTTVVEMAIAAASTDPRFPPLTRDDLATVTLEISVLSPLQKITTADTIVIGRHGLYLICGRAHGVLLPQVATEYGWDRVTFLEQTCRKAGLSSDAWRDPATEIFIFTAQICHDED